MMSTNGQMPALFTRMSIWPNCWMVFFTTAATWRREVTSQATPRVFTPVSFASWTADFLALAPFISAMTIRVPWRARQVAIP